MGLLPTIIIAARDAALVDSLQFALELEGFAVRAFAELPDALTNGSTRQRGSLLLVDQDQMSGLLSKDNQPALKRSGIPVILMMGDGAEALRDRARQAGVTHVIEKPLLGSQLLDAINEALRGAAAKPRR